MTFTVSYMEPRRLILSNYFGTDWSGWRICFPSCITQKICLLIIIFLPLYRNGLCGRQRMVFLHTTWQKICNRTSNKPGNSLRLLEGHREGQACPSQRFPACWYEKNIGFLPRQSPQRQENWLGYAWIPYGRTPCSSSSYFFSQGSGNASCLQFCIFLVFFNYFCSYIFT